MTRLEDTNQNQNIDQLHSEVAKLKKQVKRKQSKKLLSCTSCLFLLIIMLLIFSSFVGYLTAKSGLQQIPLFTDWFYNEPQPSSVVKEINFSEDQFSNLLQQKVQEKLLAENRTENLDIIFELNEQQLTALLKNKIKQNPEDYSRIDDLQIAVLDNYLELFLQFNQPENLIITMDMVPKIKDGSLELDISRLKIGDLNMPGFVGNMFLGQFLESGINTSLRLFDKYGNVQDIKLQPEIMEVEVFIKDVNLLR